MFTDEVLCEVDYGPSLPKTDVLRQSQAITACEEACGLGLCQIHDLDGRFVSGILAQLGLAVTPTLLRDLKYKSVAVSRHPMSDVWQFGMTLPDTAIFVGGLFVEKCSQIPSGIVDAAIEAGVSDGPLAIWFDRHSGLRPQMVQRLLTATRNAVMGTNQVNSLIIENMALVEQLSKMFETMTLVRDLPGLLMAEVSESAMASRVAQKAQAICNTELSACCIGKPPHRQYSMNGPWEINESELEHLIESNLTGQINQVIVRNSQGLSPIKHRPQSIRSFIAAPLGRYESHVDWLILANPYSSEELGSEEASLLSLVSHILEIHSRHREMLRERDDMVLEFVRSLVSTIDAKDAYTRGHSERVAIVAREIAIEMGLSEQEIEEIYLSGLLHDIGKIGVDDQILRKAGALTESEFQMMARHPEIGHHILSELSSMQQFLDGVLYHHERYDGTGYPSKLAGRSIPLKARVLAVADAFDAMRSDRPYRRGMSQEEVECILSKGAGEQWDPSVVQAFFNRVNRIVAIWR